MTDVKHVPYLVSISNTYIHLINFSINLKNHI